MKRFAVCSLVGTGLLSPAIACDLCSIYSMHHARGDVGKGVFLGVAEQFTHYGTLQDDGESVSNDLGQEMNSSISQVFAGYNFIERAGLQLTVPVVHRWFKRAGHDGEIEKGSESGIGDISLIGHWSPYRIESKNSTFNWNVFGGIEFPTGDTGRLREETEEHHHDEPEPEHAESGVHGHDLALGSGSYDGVVGTGLYARWKRGFFSGTMQYNIRSRGDFDYEYADDLNWSGGPGLFLFLEDEFSIALQALVSGETKGRDELCGEKADDTGATFVYLGPQLNFTWSDKLSASLAGDLPVSRDNTALQLVPDYRLRAALTWHF